MFPKFSHSSTKGICVTMVKIPCDYCGNPASTVVDSEGNCSCVACYQKFYTCAMCENGHSCPFETDPSPIPKVVMRQVRQGNMVMQTQVKNPERVKMFCFPCPCFDQDDLFCCAEEHWCHNYKEINPRLRDQRLNN